MNSELLKELSNADSVASVEDEVRSILYRGLSNRIGRPCGQGI